MGRLGSSPYGKPGTAEYRKNWRAANPEKCHQHYKSHRAKNLERMTEKRRAWREENRDFHNFRSNEWRKRNPKRDKSIRLKYRFGITVEQFEAVLVSQGGLCAICRINPATHVDHSHQTQKVRGVLCHGCNTGLGFFRETQQSLLNAVEYLKSYAD